MPHDFYIRYVYKHAESGELKTQDYTISEIEQGALCGFTALLPSFHGYELIAREFLPSATEGA